MIKDVWSLSRAVYPQASGDMIPMLISRIHDMF